MYVLGVIPARGGSKSIPRKNITTLAGEPLISYSIEAAKKSKLISDFIVSTDDKEIKEVAEQYGAKAPFMRPASLSHDRALAVPTIKHAVLEYERLYDLIVDIVVMLQPTAPLRTAIDIDAGIKLLIDRQVDSITSIVNVDNFHPYKMKKIVQGYLEDYVDSGLENPPRQSLPDVYIVNGALYIFRRDILIHDDTFKGKMCLPYEMPPERSVNIDVMSDLMVAEYYISTE